MKLRVDHLILAGCGSRGKSNSALRRAARRFVGKAAKASEREFPPNATFRRNFIVVGCAFGKHPPTPHPAMNHRPFIFAALAGSMFFADVGMPAAHAEPPTGAAATHPGFEFAETGVEIDAGSLGKFTLEYPVLLDATKEQPAHKLVGKTPARTSTTLQYEGGARVTLAAEPDGKMTMKFSSLPPDVKAIGVEMKIPIEFGEGGSWKIGSSGGAFPKDKPSMPHLYQDHARGIQIIKEGHSLKIETPEYSFLQLTDNREWNWSIYNFRALVPAETVQDGVQFSFSLGTVAGGK
jgi:hypothetical protein